MRRGQFQHVFTFLMLMIIAGIVLLLGYRFLTGILGDACEVEHVAFSEKIQDALTDYASYGSFHTPALAAPCNAQMICFIDARNFKLDEGVYIQDTDIAYLPAQRLPIEERLTKKCGILHSQHPIISSSSRRMIPRGILTFSRRKYSLTTQHNRCVSKRAQQNSGSASKDGAELC
jgi:hypothetical protein